MAQSLARMHVHLIFSTKDRRPLIREPIREPLNHYLATVLLEMGCFPVLVNSVADHVHVLFELARNVALSHAVEKAKSSASKWMKSQGLEYALFSWQAGYGAFAVSLSNVNAVRNYIAAQEKHHRRKSFQDEFLAFLKRHQISYDERYIWA